MRPWTEYDDELLRESYRAWGRHHMGRYMGVKSSLVCKRAKELGIKQPYRTPPYEFGITSWTGPHSPYQPGDREYWRGRALWYIGKLKRGEIA